MSFWHIRCWISCTWSWFWLSNIQLFPFCSVVLKNVSTYAMRVHSFRWNIQTRYPNAWGPIWIASLVRAITVSAFVKIKDEIIWYILDRTFFNRYLSCATGQTTRSQNIKYYRIPVFRGEKYVVSFTSQPGHKWSRVKSWWTSILPTISMICNLPEEANATN